MKKIVQLTTTMLASVLLLSGCGEVSFSNTSEKSGRKDQSDNAIVTEKQNKTDRNDVTDVTDVTKDSHSVSEKENDNNDKSVNKADFKLKTAYTDEEFAPSYELIDFAAYDLPYQAFSIYEYEDENKEFHYILDGTDSIVNTIKSMDEFNCNLSFATIDNTNYLLWYNSSECTDCKLNGNAVTVITHYVGIPAADIAKDLDWSEKDLVSGIDHDSISTNGKFAEKCQNIDSYLEDWRYFISSPEFYAEYNSGIMNEQYLKEALAKMGVSVAESNDDYSHEEKQTSAEKDAYADISEDDVLTVIAVSSYVYETNDPVSDEKLAELAKEGYVSEFGMQPKSTTSNGGSVSSTEYVSGYTITSYAFEDGTPVYLVDDATSMLGASFFDNNGAKYEIVNFGFSEQGEYYMVIPE